ncbi:MAG: sensor domain-containing diguanylate cyclase [Alkalibacterium gilvum]
MKIKQRIVSLLVYIFASTLLFIPVNKLHLEQNEQLYEEQQTAANEHLNRVKTEVKAHLDSSLFYADFFEMIISQNPDIEESELLKYSELIVERNTLIDNVSLAEDGVINFVYPLEGNEELIGLNVMEELDKEMILKKTYQEDNHIAQEIVETTHGNRKIFNRIPVIVDDAESEKIWGSANVVIDFDELIESTLYANQMYLFDSAIVVESDWAKTMSWGKTDIFKTDALRTSIHLPDQVWRIGTMPVEGWVGEQSYYQPEIIIFYIFIAIIFFLVMFFTHQYFNKRELSRTDMLTQLLNKKTFELSAKKTLKKSRKKNGLLLIDFNDFKIINDTYGHLMGDQVLTISANRLKHSLKKQDIIGRIGGDEIMILVNDVTISELESIKNRIIQQVEKPICFHGLTITPSVSIGHTLISQWVPFEQLYDIVDKKMYRNKSKQKIQLFTDMNHSQTDV